MVRRLARALEVIPRDAAALGHRLCGAGLQGTGKRRLLGTARPPTGPWPSGIDPDGALTLRARLGPTQEPSQAIEDLLDGTMADRFLGALDLFPHGSKATVPPSILASGTQTGTPCGHRRLLVHGALLSARGYFLIIDPLRGIYPLEECTLAHFSPQ
jgi:hypothetical protein